MQHVLFDSSGLSELEVTILIKSTGLNKNKLEDNYITPLDQPLNKFIAFSLSYDTPKKVTAKHAKGYLTELLPEIRKLNTRILLVADSDYFKYLTGVKKVSPYYGEVIPCSTPGYKDFQVILIPNFQALIYNPTIQGKMDRSLKALGNCMAGTFSSPGDDIIKTATYPDTPNQIKKTFEDLHKYPALTCDIEALSLEFWNAGVSTIGFAWDKYNGTALAVDRGMYSTYVRGCLKEFFTSYQGYLIFHNANFDMKVLVYELWMKDLADYPGMLDGIQILTKKFHDTKLVAYLATNNAVENILGLKELSAEFTGNYAEDVTDTSLIALPDLLKYNLIDCLATWFVMDKYYPIMKQDEQEELYETVMKPAVKSLLAMELCGMPVNPEKVQAAKKELMDIIEFHTVFFKTNHHIKEFHYQLLEAKAAKLTEIAKKKIYTINDPIVLRGLEMFNPASDNQVRGLLYEYFGLPAIDMTKGKQPSTGSKTLKKMINHTKDPVVLEILDHLRGIAEARIILSTFIPALENAQQVSDGDWRVFGNFNLGGTKSLRLSSSNPNLQNIPSSSTYANLIKGCFEPKPGWLFGGSDFDSLEDKINALLTHDPNKLKVYTDGFDGHCLRAFSYWPEKMPDIVEQIRKADLPGKFYKIVLDNGAVQYLHETDTKMQEYLNGNYHN